LVTKPLYCFYTQQGSVNLIEKMLLLLKVNTNEENGHEFSSFIHKLLGIFEGYDFAIMLFKNQLKQNKRENLTDPSLGIVLMSE